MASLKAEYSKITLSDLSREALERLEQLPEFKEADSFAIYHAMPDEVQTADFIEKWATQKTIYLPVICGDILQLHQYKKNTDLTPGVFGILEPKPESDYMKPSPAIIVIPGVAFDNEMNRLGRGKGYYDKLLTEPEMQQSKRIGLCFSFQMVSKVPTTKEDIRMQRIITDKEGICP